jgi:hypothetical protein
LDCVAAGYFAIEHVWTLGAKAGKLVYFVKWVGYPNLQSTWMRWDGIPAKIKPVITQWRKKNAKDDANFDAFVGHHAHNFHGNAVFDHGDVAADVMQLARRDWGMYWDESSRDDEFKQRYRLLG